MPELPEVETIRRGLAPHLTGHRVTRIDLRRPDLRFPFPAGLGDVLPGSRIVALARRAKYLLLRLTETGDGIDATLLLHLGMSGRLTLTGGSIGAPPLPGVRPNPAHDHVLMAIDSGACLVFNDPRRFGFLLLFPTAEEATHPRLAGLGPEPLSNDFSAASLAQALAGKRAPLKTALLDQHVVAGLGNIYVCEALFAARLDPRRPAGTVDAAACARLAAAIRQVLEAALAAGGSSLRDYVQASGELGYFQTQFKVYARAGEACPRCTIEGRPEARLERLTISGRSTFFCPQCQH